MRRISICHKEELHNLHSSRNTVNMKDDVMGGQTARIGSPKRLFETISVVYELFMLYS